MKNINGVYRAINSGMELNRLVWNDDHSSCELVQVSKKDAIENPNGVIAYDRYGSSRVESLAYLYPKFELWHVFGRFQRRNHYSVVKIYDEDRLLGTIEMLASSSMEPAVWNESVGDLPKEKPLHYKVWLDIEDMRDGFRPLTTGEFYAY